MNVFRSFFGLIAERNDESGKQDKEWLFNKSETRAVFSRVLVFLNPQVLSITSSVRLSIMIMEKFPSSILIVAPYLQYNWIINSSIVMFLPMNSKTNRRC
jgi:hypothetical protein